MKELIEKLKKYNSWRRGDDTVPHPHPKEVGEMIDQAIEALSLNLKNRKNRNKKDDS